MKNFYIIDEQGNPVKVKDKHVFTEWAYTNHRSVVTSIIGKDGFPIHIFTEFNYTEGYFMTYELNGTMDELYKSTTKNESQLMHQKYVEKLSLS